jgi:16S rRNA (cytosine967-C5)-methyltransferase
LRHQGPRSPNRRCSILTLKNPADTAKLASELGGDSLASGHVRLPRGQAVETLPGYAEGEWWVQDLAASLPVRSMGEGKGRTVLDLCAAPGGKTMQLAAQGWAVTALDLSAKRLARLSDNMERTGFAVETVTADLRKWDSEQQFDAVLLDAPCSATGTFRRHPDVLHRIGPKQIAELTGLQSAMLDRAAQWVKPGGMLVYATCSLEPEEGEVQAADFRARHPRICATGMRSQRAARWHSVHRWHDPYTSNAVDAERRARRIFHCLLETRGIVWLR